VKITLERLREIITEEVAKEELAPEIAGPAIAAMLRGTKPEATSDIFGDVFDQMYGKGALEDEAERMQAAQEEPEEEAEEAPLRRKLGIWTQAQKKAGQHLATGDLTPERGEIPAGLHEIIQEEYYIYLIQEAYEYTPFGKDPETGKPRNQKQWALSVLADPDAHSPSDVYEAESLEKEGFPPHPTEFVSQPAAPISTARIKDTPREIAQIAQKWEEFLAGTSRENIPDAIANLKATSRHGDLGDYEGKTIVPILKALYDRLRNFEQHAL